ncbi:glycosyl hydrolase 53 family protein [bacterium]|nr:glycosyl hydrolase 53 family protein [bacterium]
MKNQRMHVFIVMMIAALAFAQQPFYFGCDLSYVNQMEDCGAVFRENGKPKDVYAIFADHGVNLVRVRLWIDPSWWQDPIPQPEGVKSFYSDIHDVRLTLERAKNAGMQTMLGFQYSDFWADPGRQLVPHRWKRAADDLNALQDSVYQYTYHVLRHLDAAGCMPDIVKVGNENNGGILNQIAENNEFTPVKTISTSWERHADLYNAAIRAIRDAGRDCAVNPKIAIHFTNDLKAHMWNMQNMLDHGVTDFDIFGISYYYAWHHGSIRLLEQTLKDLAQMYPAYSFMVVETGYLWSMENTDNLINIIKTPDPAYLPVCPEKQLEYMVDYTRAVMRAGGLGVVFWEPAWVSTPCRTPWGQGSSHDHVAFFDPVQTNFMEDGAGNWPMPEYYQDLFAQKVIFQVDMTGQHIGNGVYMNGSWKTGAGHMSKMQDAVYSYLTYLPERMTGTYYFLSDSLETSREQFPEACSRYNQSGRMFTVPDSGIVLRDKWGTCPDQERGISPD